MLDLSFVRDQFPVLGAAEGDDPTWALFDNAGGSVPLGSVVDRVAGYMRTYGVQLGASYPLSEQAGERVAEGHRAMETWIGADAGEVVLGSSTTVNLRHLAEALRGQWRPGDEVVVTNLDHESHIGPWRSLEATGIRVREWKLRPDDASLSVADLEPLLGPRTRLVAMTHCSNVVGRIHDVRAAADLVHAAGALLCVDGVAYAPHRRVDVKALGADFYAFSAYKTYGPHQGVLWGRRELLLQAGSLGHFFIGEDEVPYKMEPGGACHELAASLPAIPEYFQRLAVHQGVSEADVYELVAEHEEELVAPLLRYLNDHPRVRIIGPAEADRRLRVPTVAFAVEGRNAGEIPPLIDRRQVAIRWGDFYAARAIEALGLSERQGVIRASMVHYNTAEEVDRLIVALDAAL